MHDLKHFGFKARSFKCFDDWQGFSAVYPINLIIGRNNAGKSALLDLVSQIVKNNQLGKSSYSRNGKDPEFKTEFLITESLVTALIKPETRLGRLQNYMSASSTARDFLDHTMITSRTPGGNATVIDPKNQAILNPQVIDVVREIVEYLTAKTGSLAHNSHCVRLRADRDIIPEQLKNHSTEGIGENGQSATSIIEYYLHEEGVNHEVVENTLLADLNEIVQPDWSFKRILPKRKQDQVWEIHLEDQRGLLVSLSHTGSGIKTLLLVLICIHLVPRTFNLNLSQFVFCFEELENNLHPAVQRRLFNFLRKLALEKQCVFFITTHSNVVIDLFSNDADAQIVHVTNDQTKAKVETVSSHLHKCRVLDDLEVRASDILQANALVWVEGPSDRLYFNQWVKVWTNGGLNEQVHYQCVWYGGASIADIGFDSNDEGAEGIGEPEGESFNAEALVNALRVNRHAIVLMDSDRRNSSDALKDRVKRVSDEVERNGGIAWVTKGKEVENYIPIGVFRGLCKAPNLPAPETEFVDIFEHVGKPSWSKHKMNLAHKVIPLLTKDMLQSVLDLAERLEQVCTRIRGWNGMNA